MSLQNTIAQLKNIVLNLENFEPKTPQVHSLNNSINDNIVSNNRVFKSQMIIHDNKQIQVWRLIEDGKSYDLVERKYLNDNQDYSFLINENAKLVLKLNERENLSNKIKKILDF